MPYNLEWREYIYGIRTIWIQLGKPARPVPGFSDRVRHPEVSGAVARHIGYSDGNRAASCFRMNHDAVSEESAWKIVVPFHHFTVYYEMIFFMSTYSI
jgi:hypothetical protein